MAKYALTLQRTLSTSASLGVVGATATARRGKVYDYTLGSEATPADAAILFVLQRFTAAGTTTAVTPQPLDPADAASAAAGGQNATVEPTYTANQILAKVALNQRATYRWVAAPGSELVYPATNASGIGIQTPTAPASLGTAQLYFEEQ